MPKDELAEALWGDTPPATWEKALTVLASKLRALLADHGVDRPDVLTSAFGCYRLALPEGSWVDVTAATSAAQEAEQALAAGDVERAKAAAAVAAALAPKQFLPGEEGAWVGEKRRELAEVHGRATTALAEAHLRSGDAGEAAKWAERTIALAPLRESAYRRLMEAHAAAGNRAEALGTYDRCRRHLAEELGAYPSPETEALYRSLLEAPAYERDPDTSAARPLPEVMATLDATVSRRGASRWTIGLAAAAAALGATIVAVAVATREDEAPAMESANAVGRIDASDGRLRDQVLVDVAPGGVAYGHGAVWVTNPFADTVARVDPERSSVRQTIPVGNNPSAIVVDDSGVWVANHHDGTVSWINPESNTDVRRIRVGSAPTAVALGLRSVWVTNAEDRSVSRIDARTGAVSATIQTGSAGRGIAFGAGSVWVTDDLAGTIVRIDPRTNRVTNRRAVGNSPGDVVYGDGAVWVTDAIDATISQIDPKTLVVRSALPLAGSPSALAYSGGAIWIALEFDQRVVKIDTRERRRTSIPLAGRPTGLAAVPEGVWVAVRPSGEGRRGGRLIVLGGPVGSIDPAVNDLTPGLSGLAYDGLTAYRRAGGSEGAQLVPNLAAALPSPTDDGRSYTFSIRPGIRYSDGTLLAPADFRRGLERILTLAQPSWLHDSALTKVAGAATCSQRACDLSRGVVVEGRDTVTFRLTEPDASFLFALKALAPVPAGTPMRDVGAAAVPSTGPYSIERYVRGRQVTMGRNPYFRSWSRLARPDGYADEIVWRIDVPPEEGVRLVLAGKADVLLNGVPAERVQELAARYPRQLRLVPQHATVFAFLNTKRAPFDDVRVRRALNYAVDRRLVAALHGGPGVAQPTCQLLPPTVPGFRRYCPYTAAPDSSGAWKAPDFEKARRLVAASGTAGEKVVVWTFPFFAKEGNHVASVLRRLGYLAELKEFPDPATYFERLNRNPAAQVGLGGWFGTQLASDTFVTLTCGFPANWARFCDPRLDANVRRLARSQASDPAARAVLARRIDHMLVHQAPWVPLFTPRLADLISSRVGNYQANAYASSSVLLDQLWVR